MKREVHVGANRHRFVEADQRPLDHVITLTVEMDALLLGPAVLAHETVVVVPDRRWIRSGLEQTQAEALRLEHEGLLLLHLIGGSPKDRGPAELAVEPSRPVVLHEQAELVARTEDATLQVAVDDLARRSCGTREREEQPLLATHVMAHVLGDRGCLQLAHARLERGHHCGHRRILRCRSLTNESELILALDRLDRVDQV